VAGRASALVPDLLELDFNGPEPASDETAVRGRAVQERLRESAGRVSGPDFIERAAHLLLVADRKAAKRSMHGLAR